MWLKKDSYNVVVVTDFENGELHSRTANSTDRNTDLSIFQHSKYVGYAKRNSTGQKMHSKSLKKNETFCHCLFSNNGFSETVKELIVLTF